MTAIADVTCGYTALTVLPEGQEVLTAEVKINLLRPVLSQKIITVGSIVKARRTLVITEANVRDAESGKLLAKMLGTMVPSVIA